MISDLITLEYINDTIRPCTPVMAAYNGCVNEALGLDITGSEKCTGNDALQEFVKIIKETATEDISDTDKSICEELELPLAYYVVARLYRSNRTSVTKFGVTTKMDDNSADITDKDCSVAATYFKTIADLFFDKFLKNNSQFAMKRDNNQPNLDIKIVGY